MQLCYLKRRKWEAFNQNLFNYHIYINIDRKIDR